MQAGVGPDSEAAGRPAGAAGGGLPKVLPVCSGPCPARHLAHSLLHLGCYWPHQVGTLSLEDNVCLTTSAHHAFEKYMEW